MHLWKNYAASWQQIFNYKGKTKRRDFWAAILGMVIVTFPLMLIAALPIVINQVLFVLGQFVFTIFLIAEFLQYLSLSVRRLHSLNLPGRYQWLMFFWLPMLILHSLPEVDIDGRAPWYNMVSPDNEPSELVVDHKGYVHGILGNAFITAWHNMFNFKGTTSRGNYMWSQFALSIFGLAYSSVIYIFSLIFLFINLIAQDGKAFSDTGDFHASFIGAMILMIIVMFILLFPLWFAQLSLLVRRLHDQDLSGGWAFLYLASSIGAIILLILSLLPGKEQTRFPAADGRVKSVPEENMRDEA